MKQWDTATQKKIFTVLEAIAQGHPASGWDDRFIIVANPIASAEAMAIDGVDPNLVLDVWELSGLEFEDGEGLK
jgi:hypothetical protein